MKALNLRPLALFCLSFFIFDILFCNPNSMKISVATVSLVLSAVLFLLFCRLWRNLYLRSCAIIALALCSSLFFTAHYIDKPLNDYTKFEGTHQISGKITETEWTNSYSCGYVAQIYTMDGKTVDLTVSLNSSEILKRGDTFTANAELSSVKDEENISYFIARKAFLVAEATKTTYTGQNLTTSDKLYEINQRLSAKLVDYMGENSGGFAASMFLGNRDYLKDNFTNSVTKLGLAHVIALSGMHLTVICSMLSLFLSNFGAKASRLCSIPIVMFYIILTGFFASIVRAGIMLVCYNLISFTGRANDQPTNLGISALLIIISDPASVCDIGFQLSVVAMLGVFATLKLMGGQSIERDSPKIKTIKALLLPFVMGIISTGFTMIPVVFYFGYITPASIIATIPFSFMGDVVLWLSPFVLLLGNIPLVGDMLSILCEIPCKAFIELALFLGRSNKITVEADKDPQIWLAIIFSVLFMTVFVLNSKKAQKIMLIISLSFLTAFAGISGHFAYVEYNSVIFSSVAIPSGDGFVVSCKDDTTIVDISNGSQKMYRYLANNAADMHKDEIDRLVIADPHAAHAYNLWILTEKVDVSEIWMPDEADSKDIASMIEYETKIVYYSTGDCIETESYTIVTYEDKYLDRSIVPIVRFMVDTEEKDLFYIGTAATEAELTPEDSDYLWIGGYGPKNKIPIEINSTHSHFMVSEKSAEFCTIDLSKLIAETIILKEP